MFTYVLYGRYRPAIPGLYEIRVRKHCAMTKINFILYRISQKENPLIRIFNKNKS